LQLAASQPATRRLPSGGAKVGARLRGPLKFRCDNWRHNTSRKGGNNLGNVPARRRYKNKSWDLVCVQFSSISAWRTSKEATSALGPKSGGDLLAAQWASCKAKLLQLLLLNCSSNNDQCKVVSPRRSIFSLVAQFGIQINFRSCGMSLQWTRV